MPSGQACLSYTELNIEQQHMLYYSDAFQPVWWQGVSSRQVKAKQCPSMATLQLGVCWHDNWHESIKIKRGRYSFAFELTGSFGFMHTLPGSQQYGDILLWDREEFLIAARKLHPRHDCIWANRSPQNRFYFQIHAEKSLWHDLVRVMLHLWQAM